MSRRVVTRFLILWVCLVLPMESFAYVAEFVTHDVVAAAKQLSHTAHHAAPDGDKHGMKCCKSGNCPDCGKSSPCARTCAKTCAKTCASSLTPSLAFESAFRVRAHAVCNQWPPMATEIAPPHTSRLLRPPIG